MKMTLPDYFILCSIYLELISDRQCYVLYNMVHSTRSTFIPGSMPLGDHFWYTHKTILDDYMFNELKNRDYEDGVTTIFMVFICRILLREEGIK